ncbi:hypothetical protein FPS10_21805 [Pseudoruegeria sp. M32A2M]|nr:hypothetical protein [Pseudoruegeria sp. M32A2M]
MTPGRDSWILEKLLRERELSGDDTGGGVGVGVGSGVVTGGVVGVVGTSGVVTGGGVGVTSGKSSGTCWAVAANAQRTKSAPAAARDSRRRAAETGSENIASDPVDREDDTLPIVLIERVTQDEIEADTFEPRQTERGAKIHVVAVIGDGRSEMLGKTDPGTGKHARFRAELPHPVARTKGEHERVDIACDTHQREGRQGTRERKLIVFGVGVAPGPDTADPKAEIGRDTALIEPLGGAYAQKAGIAEIILQRGYMRSELQVEQVVAHADTETEGGGAVGIVANAVALVGEGDRGKNQPVRRHGRGRNTQQGHVLLVGFHLLFVAERLLPDGHGGQGRQQQRQNKARRAELEQPVTARRAGHVSLRSLRPYGSATRLPGFCLRTNEIDAAKPLNPGSLAKRYHSSRP